MHVLIVTSCYERNAMPHMGLFVKDQARALVARQHKVGVLHEHWMMPREVLPKIFSRRLFKSVDIQCHDGVLVVDVQPWVGFPFLSRFFVRFRIEQAVQAFQEYTQKYGMPDILHAHFDSLGGLICMKIKEIYGIPFGITEHSSKYVAGAESRKIAWLHNCWHAASFRIAVSVALADVIAVRYKFANSLENIVVLGNLLNPAFLEPLNIKIKENQSDVVFCTIGNLIKRKCVHNILKALSIVQQKIPQSKLLIIGDGPEKKELVSLSERLNIQDLVQFVGQKSTQGVRGILDQSDIFVLASQHETFGVVCIEAMARGLPVVATKCGGPNEFMDDGNGELVECDDVESLARGMISVAQKSKEFIPEKIRQSVVRKYSADAICSRLEELYQRALI